MTENGEEENGTTKKGGRPNAFWAKVREEQLEEQEGDGFGGAFRGVKAAPRGGSVTVTAEQTLGTDELCWCGQPVGHSWPGKSVGAKHPKVEDMSNPGVAADLLDRRDLRAFHRRLQDFVLLCIGPENNLRYRQTKNGVMLYPPDGSTPMTVHARNTDRQLRQLQKWYIEHVHIEDDDETVDQAALRRLAEAKNDPVEHPATEPVREPEKGLEYQDEPAKPEEYLPPPPEQKVDIEGKAYEVPDTPEVFVTNTEWKPLMRSDDQGPSDYFVTDGTRIRCTDAACKGTEHEYIKSVMSQGGHIRMYHTDTTTLHGPEAKARAVETSRANRQREKVVQAIDILAEAVGHTLASPAALADWEKKYNTMTVRAEQAEERAERAEKKADELEAKLALIREATGL